VKITKLQEKYPDANISYGDTEEDADIKINYGTILDYVDLDDGSRFTLEQAKDIKESKTPPEWFKNGAQETAATTFSEEDIQSLWDTWVRDMLNLIGETSPTEPNEGDKAPLGSLENKYLNKD